MLEMKKISSLDELQLGDYILLKLKKGNITSQFLKIDKNGEYNVKFWAGHIGLLKDVLVHQDIYNLGKGSYKQVNFYDIKVGQTFISDCKIQKEPYQLTLKKIDSSLYHITHNNMTLGWGKDEIDGFIKTQDYLFLINAATNLSGKICPDCKGSRKYIGFNTIEDCRTCNGTGEI